MNLSGVGIWSSQTALWRQGGVCGCRSGTGGAGIYRRSGYPTSARHRCSTRSITCCHRRTEIVIATGILNLWMNEPADVAASYASLSAAHGDRFLMGIGVSHAPLIDATEPGDTASRWRRPRRILDALDNAEQPVPVDARVLAALGPKMLALAANRARGAHPYLATPEHTHRARELLGDGPLLLPEQTAILTDDADEARAIGTGWLRRYLAMPNYANSMLRLGFSPDDVASVSDRLFDAIIVWGDEEAVMRPGERAPVRGCGPRVRPGSHRRPHGLPARAMAPDRRRARQ